MPTRYWLVRPAELRLAVDRLESAGGVRAAEAAVDPVEAGRRPRGATRAERDAAVPRAGRDLGPPAGWAGPAPGVKCLHAHYAWYLAGGDDPVGRWVEERLASTGFPVLRAER